MTKQIINTGTSANSKTGDSLRTAFTKINENFTELYSAIGADVQIPAQAGNSGKYLTTNGNTLSWANIISLVNGTKTVSLGTDGNLTLPQGGVITSNGVAAVIVKAPSGSQAVLANNAGYNAVVAQDQDVRIVTSSDGGINGQQNWNFGTNGTLTLPSSIYPITFTATLDAAHCTTPITLTGDAWTFNIHFTTSPNGTVDINTDQPPPVFFANPGYNNARTFRFTEADHGIPGYTLDIFLANIGANPPIGFTPIINFEQAPVYPSTLTSEGPIKLSSHNHHWAFGADGSLTFPHGAGFGNGDSGQLKVNDGTTVSLDFRDYSGRGFYTNSDGYTLRSNGSYSWTFGSDAILSLPQNLSVGAAVIQPNASTFGLKLISNGNTWAFGTNGSMTFPDNTTQTTAYQKVAAPAHSYGAAGNKVGMVAFDGNYIYYCKQDYVNNSTNIWVRVAWSGTSW